MNRSKAKEAADLELLTARMRAAPYHVAAALLRMQWERTVRHESNWTDCAWLQARAGAMDRAAAKVGLGDLAAPETGEESPHAPHDEWSRTAVLRELAADLRELAGRVEAWL